MNIRSN